MKTLNQKLQNAELKIKYNNLLFNRMDYKYVTYVACYEDVDSLLNDVAKNIKCRKSSLQIEIEDNYINILKCTKNKSVLIANLF